MSKPGLGVILREPFEPGDETFRALQFTSHIVLFSRFGGLGDSKYPVKGLFAAQESIDTGIFSGRNYSVFVSTISRGPKFLAALHEDFMRFMDIKTIYIEVNTMNGDQEFWETKEFVTNLLALRPEVKVGIVSGLYAWKAKEFTSQFDSLLNLGSASQVFPCPLVNSMDECEKLPVGCTPIIFMLPNEDKQNFSELMARYSDKFAEFIFWRPGAFSGIEIKEIQQMDETPTISKFKALYPSAKRVSPSLAAVIRGNLVVGEEYEILEQRDGKMGVTFGKLSDGLWVVLTQGKEVYLEEQRHEK